MASHLDPSRSGSLEKQSNSDDDLHLRDGNDAAALSRQGRKQRQRRTRLILLAIFGVVVALAIALGVGLGVGLDRRRGKTTATAARLPVKPRESLVDASQLTLSPSFDVTASPQDRVYNWTLTEILSSPAGVEKMLRVVNGLSPGPLIEANLGDRIIVHVQNDMSVPTSLHWHGQYQRGSNHMDGTVGVTECGIAPGNAFTYNWTVQQTGTYWWHSHYGPTYADGLFGPLILHGDEERYRLVGVEASNTTDPVSSPTATAASTATNDTTTTTEYDEDYIFILNDMYQSDSFAVAASAASRFGPDGTQGDEPTPDYGVINGLGTSNCALAPSNTTCISDTPSGRTAYNFTVGAGKRVRLRVINAGSMASWRFSVDGHALTVIEADGTEIQPHTVQSLNVMVAQRYSVLITTDRPEGAYAVRAQMLDDMFAYDNPALVADQYAIMRYPSIPASAIPMSTEAAAGSMGSNVTESLDTTSLVPLSPINPPPSNWSTTLVVNFGLDANSNWRAFFNQSTFTGEMAPIPTLLRALDAAKKGNVYTADDDMLLTITSPAVMDVVINNLDEGEHPFHLHGFTPFLLESGKGNHQPTDVPASYTNPMRRDVFSIPPYSYLKIRIDARENYGVFGLHCHLMPHMAIGLLMQFQIRPEALPLLPIGPEVREQCDAMAAYRDKNGGAM